VCVSSGYQNIDSDDMWKRADDVTYVLRYAGIGKRWCRPVSVATRSRGGDVMLGYVWVLLALVRPILV
jgi:hypothetical protein